MNSRIKEDVSKLFEYWCDIAPAQPGEKLSGHVVECYPDTFHDEKIISDIAAFAFPCDFEKKTITIHSFVLTNIDSKWRFGFCRHDPKSSTAMVLITYLPWHDTFIKFLNVLADIKKTSPNEFQTFLSDAYTKGVPEPGAHLKLHYDRTQQTFQFQRPSQFQLPSIPENHNLNVYYNFVEPKTMIGIFAAMLAERRIIFVSRRLDILSSCVLAANAFLYPMVWQHIFIPVLPMKMKDILGAPMPFLIGVPEAVYENLKRDEIGDVVILNCDKRILETPFEDVKNMPQELVASLKKQLSNPAEHRGDRVSKIFLGILVQLIGGYRDAVKFNNKITFDPDTFIESRPSHLRPFLTNMLHLQIFQQFIEERLHMLNTGQGFSDEFELENFRYAEKTGKKVKLLNKDFFRNVKDKTNPAVKSAVKSVKEHGRGVKTAYKGLRSKFREQTPPKSKLDSSSNFHTFDIAHQSAPNSPVFSKRPQTIALADESFHNHKEAITPSSASLFNSPHIMTNNNSIYSGSDVRSPSLSPTSPNSNSSSEMNLLQELQQFALFKSPAINRNSFEEAAVTTSNNDLINLEANSSFEIEDFDPLNENARPIPHVPSFTKSATSSPPTSSLTVNNGQINPYFTPQHHANHFSNMSMSLVAHKKPETQDDIELLRNYGLDKFTLLEVSNGGKDDGKFSNGTKNPFKDGFLTQQRPSSSSRSFSTGQSSWTTFD